MVTVFPEYAIFQVLLTCPKAVAVCGVSARTCVCALGQGFVSFEDMTCALSNLCMDVVPTNDVAG